MVFISYPKIHRLGKEENEGILHGTVYIQEKIDGANASVWLEDGEIVCGSRTRKLEEGFRGLVDYVKSHTGLKDLFAQHPDYRLYGEWLVRHTISYNETVYQNFYLFDILDNDQWLSPLEVEAMAKKFNLNHAYIFSVIENPKEDDVKEFVGISKLGDKGEGVVLKNPGFINRFGNRCYAKIVTQSFKEDNATVFGGNNKHSETYWEQYVVNKYLEIARVKKVMQKMEAKLDEKLDLKHTPIIANASYHDMLTEEIWDIQKKVLQINFSDLKRLSLKKSIRLYHDILNGHESVAYNPMHNEETYNA